MSRSLNITAQFPLKIAIFNSIGFAFAVGVPTFLDPQLDHIVYGSRTYYLGVWVLAITPIVFALTYYGIRNAKSSNRANVISFIPLCVFGIVVLPNFLPEFPHGHIGTWIPLYGIASFISSWIHNTKLDTQFLQNPTIYSLAKIERLKEYVSLWRTIAIAIFGGYLSIIVPWLLTLMKFNEKLFIEPSDQILSLSWNVTGVALFSIYVLIGPILESFRKVKESADGLKEIYIINENDQYSRNDPDR